MELYPVKVKITLKENGMAKYPDFNKLQCVITAKMDWSNYIDKNGSGWHYDECGLKDEEVGSKYGIQYGLILTPETFAKEAVIAFPSLVENMTATEAETFYNDKVHKQESELIVNKERLEEIKLLSDLNISLTTKQQQEITDAKNPNNDTSGVIKNKYKKFADYKILKGITIKNLKTG